MNGQKKLTVKNLSVSFHTDNGRLRAVRDISFELGEGETLAIVGESGSGKSVTSKAIMGILAPNATVESGEIIYGGQDLVKISERDFKSIRGDKIAMIFQNPLSSLNPIVKIGKQLTEAMLLNGRARRRESRAEFNTLLARLRRALSLTVEGENANETARELCKGFDRFEYKHLALECEYNAAREAAEDAAYEIEALLFELERGAARDLPYRVRRVERLARLSIHKYLVWDRAEELRSLAKGATRAIRPTESGEADKREELIAALRSVKEILDTSLLRTQPNFFTMGFYLTNSSGPLPEMETEELNKFLRKYLDENFMLDFLERLTVALRYCANGAADKKREAIEALRRYRPVFEREVLSRRECNAALSEMNGRVCNGIDGLELVKDSFSFTFYSGMKGEIDRYFSAVREKAREEKMLKREKAAYDRRAARGLSPDAAVIPVGADEPSVVRNNMLHQIDRLIENLEARISEVERRDYASEAVAIVDYLKSCASGAIHRVTRSMAKNRALKLMGEVGIPDARIRFNQYPFQFSGGMRQRIVIAIALAADPDVLICDEPTTALDVTIQAQILELINRLKAERGISVIFITHDLGVVANTADRIAVMYAGKIVEYGTSEEVFYDPRHPYTWALLSSMPDLNTSERLEAIPGTPPNMIYPPVGDAFAARNKYAMKIDFERQPPMFRVSETHSAATWLLHKDAPRVEPPKIIRDRIEKMKVRGKNEG